MLIGSRLLTVFRKAKPCFKASITVFGQFYTTFYPLVSPQTVQLTSYFFVKM